MKVIENTKDLPQEAKNFILAIGNFDGFHLGHQSILHHLDQALKNSKTSYPTAVLTFSPHPKYFFTPETPPFHIMNIKQKISFLKNWGIDYLFLMPFTQELVALSPEKFVQTVLIDQLQVHHVIVGENFTFGHKKSGTTDHLISFGKDHNFNTTIVPSVTTNGQLCSSTAVREFLKVGNVKDASKILGRNWTINGRVKKGDGIGHTIGFPTANISLGDYLVPQKGVYFIKAHINNYKNIFYGVVNVGSRPTFNFNSIQVEAHLFNFNDDIYGEMLEIEFLEFIRPEKKFKNVEELVKNIQKDCLIAKKFITDYERKLHG